MKFHPAYRTSPKPWNEEPYLWAQLKRDGHRITLIRKFNKIRAYSREVCIDVWPDIKHLKVFQRAHLMPTNSVIDGELWAPSVAAASIKTLINNNDYRLRYDVFAIPFLCDIDYRLEKDLELIERKAKELGYDWAPLSKAIDISKALEFAKTERAEGLVLKQRNYYGWFKTKFRETIDCVVMDVIMGAGKFSNLVGAIELGLFDGQNLVSVGRVGTGFTDEERQAIDPISSIGKTIEVFAEGIGAKGALKFPAFRRWRDDKPAKDCVISQLEIFLK